MHADCVVQPDDEEWRGSLFGRHVLVKFDRCKYYLGVVVFRNEVDDTWHGQLPFSASNITVITILRMYHTDDPWLSVIASGCFLIQQLHTCIHLQLHTCMSKLSCMTKKHDDMAKVCVAHLLTSVIRVLTYITSSSLAFSF